MKWCLDSIKASNILYLHPHYCFCQLLITLLSANPSALQRISFLKLQMLDSRDHTGPWCFWWSQRNYSWLVRVSLFVRLVGNIRVLCKLGWSLHYFWLAIVEANEVGSMGVHREWRVLVQKGQGDIAVLVQKGRGALEPRTKPSTIWLYYS